MNEVIWYADKSNELVDHNDNTEQEIINTINESLAKEGTDILAQNALETLSKEDLSKFISKECFPDWQAKTYGEIKNLPYINFSLRAALQYIWTWNQNKYDGNWEINENGKTIDKYLKEKWWITNEYDEWLVKFLQKIVWAEPDGKAGPQTIRMVLDKLWYDWIDSSAESINSLYAWSDKFKINKIKQIEVWDTTYNYNESRIEITENDSWQSMIKIKWQKSLWEVLNIENGKIEAPSWFKIDNGWIVLNKPSESWSWDTETPKERSVWENEESYDGNLNITITEQILADLKYTKAWYFLGIATNTTISESWYQSTQTDYNYFHLSKANQKVSIPVKDLLNTGWNIKKDALSIITKYEKKLENIKLANDFAEKLRWKTFNMRKIYPNFDSMSPVQKADIKEYFSIFSDNRLEIDTSFSFTRNEWDQIILRLNNKWVDRSYNKYDDNTKIGNQNLKFEAINIKQDNTDAVDEKKLIKQLRKIVDYGIRRRKANP